MKHVELYYQNAAFAFIVENYDHAYMMLENGLLLNPAKHYILFQIVTELKSVPAVRDLIAQYSTT